MAIPASSCPNRFPESYSFPDPRESTRKKATKLRPPQGLSHPRPLVRITKSELEMAVKGIVQLSSKDGMSKPKVTAEEEVEEAGTGPTN